MSKNNDKRHLKILLKIINEKKNLIGKLVEFVLKFKINYKNIVTLEMWQIYLLYQENKLFSMCCNELVICNS